MKMARLKKKITKAAKKGIAKQIGKQVRELLEKKGPIKDAGFLDFTKKYTEYMVLQTFGEKKTAQQKTSVAKSCGELTKKDIKFKFKPVGLNKVAKDVLFKNKDIGKAFKDNNVGFKISCTIRW